MNELVKKIDTGDGNYETVLMIFWIGIEDKYLRSGI